MEEDTVLFEDYVYFPRDREISTGRWSKFYLVLTPKRLSVHPAPQLKNQFLVDIDVSDIEYLHELGSSEEERGTRLSVISKERKSKFKFEWNMVLLEIAHNRLFAFGKMPDKTKWKDCVTQLSSVFTPNPSPGFKINEDHKEHHNEHFFRDKETDQKGGEVLRNTDVTLTSLNQKTERLISFPAKTVIRQLSATGYHAIAVTVEGRAFVWGEQRDPLHPILGLGHDERVSVKVPTEITTPFQNDQVVTSCAGMTTSVVLSSKGSIAVWGRMVGDDGLMVKVVSPKIFAPLKSKFVSSVATFAEVCLAVIRVPGLEDVTEVWSWGSGSFGLLGHNHIPSDAEERSGIFATPREIETLRDDTIVDLSISSTHAMCCNAVGDVYVWGRNTCKKMIGTVGGVLGPTGKENDDFIMLPTKVQGFGKTGVKVTQVSAGEAFCLALAKTKQIYSWGYSGKHLLLGQPFDAIQHSSEGLLALTTPTIVPNLDNVKMVNTNGRLSLAKTEEGALYWFGHKEKQVGENILNCTGTANDSFTTSICCGLGGYLTVTGNASAMVAYGNERRIVSSVWHSTTSHIYAFVERVWKKKRDSFIIFDSLGKLCPGKKPTSFLIERMLMRNADPVFIVVDKQTLLGGYGGRVEMAGDVVRWAEKGALLELLFMFPSSSFSTPPPKTITPRVLTTFSQVFFLTYLDNLKFNSHEILEFLLGAYSKLDSLDGKKIEDDEVEHWIPTSLDNEVRKSVQMQLPKTRMTRILKSIREWLKIRPTDFLGSSRLMQQLLQFLQKECDHHHPTVSSMALHVRRKFFLEILMADSGVVAPSRVEESEKSVFFLFKPEEIAKQLTWIDANIIFPSFSTVDILRHKTPKAIQRHASLACWVEKEILECPEDRRMRMVEAVIEVMDCLNSMGNYFSYTSLMGACRQKGFRRATGNVWEKGRGLKQTTHAKWEGLKKEDMQERMLKPQVFTAYFEERPEPKIPFVGYYWHRLIYVAERYKSFSPPSEGGEGEEGGEEGKEGEEGKGAEFCLVERCTAEGEVVLWLREVFKTAGEKYKEKYNIKPDPKMLHILMHARGFRADPKAHRRVADSYGLGKDNDKDKEKEKEKEKEEEGMLFGEEEDGEGGAGEDVEALLLSGRASFVSLSSRLRRDAWGEWKTKIVRELEPQQQQSSSVRLHPVKHDAPWKTTKLRFATLRRMINNSSLLQHEPYPVGSFVSLLMSSDALEITLVSLLSCFPAEKTRNILEDILKLLFGNNFPAEALTGTTLEMSEQSVGSGPLIVSSFQNSEHQKMCEKVLWKIVGLSKIFQPLLTISEQDFGHVESMILLFSNLERLAEKWKPKFKDFNKKERDDLWEAFTVASEYSTLIEDSYLKNLCALPSSELTFPEIETLNERMQGIQKEKYKALLAHNRNEVQDMIDLLTTHLSLLSQEINEDEPSSPSSSIPPPVSSSPPPPLTSSAPSLAEPPRPARSNSNPSASVPSLPSLPSLAGGLKAGGRGGKFAKEHAQMLEDMKDRVRGYREVGRSVLVSRGEGESDFQRVHTFYEQMLATVKSRLNIFANLSQILEEVTESLKEMVTISTENSYGLFEADPESRKGENHNDYINIVMRMSQLGMKTSDDLRLTNEQDEGEENDNKGSFGLPSGIMNQSFDKRRSLMDFAAKLENPSEETRGGEGVEGGVKRDESSPNFKPPPQFKAQPSLESSEKSNKTTFASFKLKMKKDKDKEKKLKRKGSKADPVKK